MQKTRIITAALLACLAAPRFSQADPFDPKKVPADAKWVLHADVDAARDTKSFDLIRTQMLSRADAQAKFDEIEKRTGLRIPDDVHDFTIYGREAGDEAGVVLLHGNIDRSKTMTTFRQSAQQYASNPYGHYEIFTWFDTDKSQTMYAAFRDESNVILGRSEKNIQAALDVIDGKSEAIKTDSPLAAGAKPQLLVYVAARDLAQLHGSADKPNPLLQSVDSAWISMAETDQMVNLRAELTGASADAAKDLQSTLQGLKGMVSLAARNTDADPVAKAVAGASKSFTTTQKNDTVDVNWPIPIDQAQVILQAVIDKHNN